jgi:hypothetical protein
MNPGIHLPGKKNDPSKATGMLRLLIFLLRIENLLAIPSTLYFLSP